MLGRVDAVLLDNVLAEPRVRAHAGFTVQPQSVAIGHYVGVLSARATPRCAIAIDEILRGAMRDGALERIFRKWEVWNDDQPALYARLLAREPVAPIAALDASSERRPRSRDGHAARRYLPSLLRASVITIVLVVPRRWRWRSGSACSSPAAASMADRLVRGALTGIRGADARHADPAAAVRDLLRPRRRRPLAGLRRPLCSASA